MKRALLWIALLALLQWSTALWVAQRYNYPKDGAIPIANFGLERGGRYELDVSFRMVVNIPSSFLSASPWPSDAPVWPPLSSLGLDVLVCSEDVMKEVMRDGTAGSSPATILSSSGGFKSILSSAQCHNLDRLRDCSLMAKVSVAHMAEYAQEQYAPAPPAGEPLVKSKWYELIGHGKLAGFVPANWKSGTTVHSFFQNGPGPSQYSFSLLTCAHSMLASTHIFQAKRNTTIAFRDSRDHPLSKAETPLSNLDPSHPSYTSIPLSTQPQHASSPSSTSSTPISPLMFGEMQVITVRGWFVNPSSRASNPTPIQSKWKWHDFSSSIFSALKPSQPDIEMGHLDNHFAKPSSDDPQSSQESWQESSSSSAPQNQKFIHSSFTTSSWAPMFWMHVAMALLWTAMVTFILANAFYFRKKRLSMISSWKKGSRKSSKRQSSVSGSRLNNSHGFGSNDEEDDTIYPSDESESNESPTKIDGMLPSVHLLLRLTIACFIFYNLYLVLMYRDLHQLGYISMMGVMGQPGCASPMKSQSPSSMAAFSIDPLAKRNGKEEVPKNGWDIATPTSMFKWTRNGHEARLNLLASLSCTPIDVLAVREASHPPNKHTGMLWIDEMIAFWLQDGRWQWLSSLGPTPSPNSPPTREIPKTSPKTTSLWPTGQWMLHPVLPSVFLSIGIFFTSYTLLYVAKGGSLTRARGLESASHRMNVALSTSVSIAALLALLSSNLSISGTDNSSHLYPLPSSHYGNSWWLAHYQTSIKHERKPPSSSPYTCITFTLPSSNPHLSPPRKSKSGSLLEEVQPTTYSSSAFFQSVFIDMPLVWNIMFFGCIIILAKACIASSGILLAFLDRQITLLYAQLNRSSSDWLPSLVATNNAEHPPQSQNAQSEANGEEETDDSLSTSSSSIASTSPLNTSSPPERTARRHSPSSNATDSPALILSGVHSSLLKKVDAIRRVRAATAISFALFSLIWLLSPSFSPSKAQLLSALFFQMVPFTLIAFLTYTFMLKKAHYKEWVTLNEAMEQEKSAQEQREKQEEEKNKISLDKRRSAPQTLGNDEGDDDSDESHIGLRLDDPLIPSPKSSPSVQPKLKFDHGNGTNIAQHEPFGQGLLHEASLMADARGFLSDDAKDRLLERLSSNPQKNVALKKRENGKTKKRGSEVKEVEEEGGAKVAPNTPEITPVPPPMAPPATLIIIFPPSVTREVKKDDKEKPREEASLAHSSSDASLPLVEEAHAKPAAVVPLHPKLAARLKRSSPLPPSLQSSLDLDLPPSSPSSPSPPPASTIRINPPSVCIGLIHE